MWNETAQADHRKDAMRLTITMLLAVDGVTCSAAAAPEPELLLR